MAQFSRPALQLALAVIACLAVPAFATSFAPARIGDHDTSLAKRIAFPKVDGDYTVFVRCEAKVLPRGNIAEIGCYGDEKVDEAFYWSVTNAASGATVLPATVDGEHVDLLLLFSVIFRQVDGQRTIAVVPNHGTNAAELGIQYIAPQRYGRSNLYRPRTELGLLWIDATMDIDGTLHDVEYVETKWTNRETRRYAKSYATENDFIPGHFDGKPLAMRYVKPIFGHRNGFMWQPNDSKCGNSTLSCDEKSKTTGKPRFVFED